MRTTFSTPRARGLLLLGLLLILAAAAAVYFALRPLPAADPEQAWRFCEDIILAELPAPSTAIFDPFDAQKVTADSDTIYRVMLGLDTEDSGGRWVRLNGLCRLRWDGAALDLLGLQLR